MNASPAAVWTSIEELSEQHLGGLPSPAALAVMKKAESQRVEVRDFVERAFRLMKISRFRAADITSMAAEVMGVLLAGTLPGAWGGLVPPITMTNRHLRLDAYLRSNPWATFPEGTVLLEMGCGFPPQTAMDAARAFPQWQVIGADPCFAEYLIHDERGNYACLDHGGVTRFFSPVSPANLGEAFALYQDREDALRGFSELFARLKGMLPTVPDGDPAIAEHNMARLVRNPVRLYETPNLRLIQAGLGTELPQADIIRCFNVLPYFDAAFRKMAESWALRTLRPGGLFICGSDAVGTTSARYSVYRSEGGRLVAKEYAFSIDNVRTVGGLPWFTLHEEEQETWMLAKAVGVLRSNERFCVAFDSRLDALLEEKRLFARQPDGYLAAAPNQLPQAEWATALEEIPTHLEQEGFADDAAEVLGSLGLQAWVNAARHVAFRPAD